MTGALFELIAAHCIFCDHVERAAEPNEVHAAMERHYATRHSARIDALVETTR